ncbi:unnamed protein product [Rhizophagus irregularis]|nr:unnamed protein product [Rhizophagus irregularis]CAB4443938.1 unnamed protein product [Rhizophagus irregularis]
MGIQIVSDNVRQLVEFEIREKLTYLTTTLSSTFEMFYNKRNGWSFKFLKSILIKGKNKRIFCRIIFSWNL